MKRPEPLTHAGRQTMIYLVMAVAGPVLTAILVWAMVEVRDWNGASPVTRLDAFARLAWWVCVSLFTIIIALSCFVSIRAIRVGRAGIEAEANDNGDDDPQPVATVTTTVAVPSSSPPNMDSGGSPPPR